MSANEFAVPEPPFWLEPRAPSVHKGDCGRVVVVAGARRYAGAAHLACLGAARSGAGLVVAMAPRSIAPVLRCLAPHRIVLEMPETSAGAISIAAARSVADAVAGADALVVGCGMTRDSWVGALLRRAIAGGTAPVVIDADALVLLGAQGLAKIGHRSVVTPHPGEAARVLETTTRVVQADREGAARRIASLTGGVCVLKGSGTVVVAGDRVFVNATGNPGMATGGTGDVLAGVIGALLARVDDPFIAATLGVWAHGLAGDLAARDRGIDGLLPEDLAARLGSALEQCTVSAES